MQTEFIQNIQSCPEMVFLVRYSIVYFIKYFKVVYNEKPLLMSLAHIRHIQLDTT